MAQTDLVSKRALVLGAESGTGQAISIALAEGGADVAVVASKDDALSALAAKRLGQRISALGRHSQAIAIDASLITAFQVTTRQIVKHFGGLDVAVINVEEAPKADLSKLNEAHWSHLVSTNLSAVLFAVRAVAQEMGRRDGGIVIAAAKIDGNGPDAILRATALELVNNLSGGYRHQAVRIGCITYSGDDLSLEVVETVLALATQRMDPSRAIHL